MAMKPSLQLRVVTQLTMTPQLQQAISLLQLSTLDLRQEIQQALESNPMLELDEAFGEEIVETSQEEDWAEDIPEELSTDSEWSDTFQDFSSPGTTGEGPDVERNAQVTSLRDHLFWQLAMSDIGARERRIAENLIDAVDANGYLQGDLLEIQAGMKAQGMSDLKLVELETVLTRLQQFEPVGVLARTLAECLLIQLENLTEVPPFLAQAKRLVRQFLDALANSDRKLLKRRLSLTDDALQQVIDLILGLNPRPGDAFDTSTSDYVIPDLLARRVQDDWRIELNPDALPRMHIQPDYAALIRRADNSDDNTFMKQHLQEARWLVKSLSSRNDTLLKVGQEIMAHQLDFLEQGDKAMKPLVLAEIATRVEMHESTVSRVTTQKFIHTPQGVFELKHFFSSQLGGGDGEIHSGTAIRTHLLKLIRQEAASKPLSDSKLVDLLAEEGIQVARRTVAKYRETLGIPPSNERKRLSHLKN